MAFESSARVVRRRFESAEHRGDPNRISQAFSLEPDGIATLNPACDRDRLAGFHWANPSTPLDASSYVFGKRSENLTPREMIRAMLTPTDEPLSPRYAEPASQPVLSPRTRGR